MQEPEIFEQPVRTKDPEALVAGEENTYHTGYTNATDESTSLHEYHDFVYPEDRKLGTWSTAFLIINRVVGTGIFSTPSSIIRYTNSVGATLLFWVLGGVMTFALFVYLEFGTALPRSGGEKVYLERVYQKPRYLATCIFAVQFVLFATSTGGAISFSAYILRAANGHVTPGSWETRGIAIAALTVVCLIHAFLPRLGIWLSNGLGAFKLILLTLVVCTGWAALDGRMVRESPKNFSSFNGPDIVGDNDDSMDPTRSTAGYALALLQVMYSYSGWENANYVLTEVRDAPRTLRRAAPIAVSAVTILYVLANIAYFAAMSKAEIRDSNVLVGAAFFRNVWGDSPFVTRAMPVFIGLSSLGNVFAQSFAMPRVKQELAKEGILPFSRFWASDWPISTPTGAILLHWLLTAAFILGSQTTDVYTFVTNIFIYSGNWIKFFLGVGLLYLNFTPSERWAEQRTTFRSSPLLTLFWIIGLLFVLSAPFVPNELQDNIPFFVVPALGTSMLAIGTAYWLIWAKVLPGFGFHIQHEIVQMPDGSERVKYKRVKPKRMRRRKQRQRSVW
ncbi:amino acid permease-domain-containing protein [Apodospora peruviana]|uniref:Amino acid permease-domain-containing protein n=1 Tax=Apodospora peruviana TaxID=516989 RepID=A0AAE0M8L0_9PEZI|nr:amino acid permease-domain-containing protein [Apodospora peruviana]